MCFSATASFSGAAVIGAVGVASIARNQSTVHRMYAATPLLFAAQQATEGVVWLTMPGADHARVHQLAINTFLAFALVVWPTWIPTALHRIERNEQRRELLKWLLYFGNVVSLGALMMLFRAAPIVVIRGHSLSYEFAGPANPVLSVLVLLAYIIATFAPLFVSTSAMSKTVAAALLVSIVIAFVVQHDALTSVWCFFAAFVSSLIMLAVGRDQRVPVPVRERNLAVSAQR